MSCTKRPWGIDEDNSLTAVDKATNGKVKQYLYEIIRNRYGKLSEKRSFLLLGKSRDVNVIPLKCFFGIVFWTRSKGFQFFQLPQINLINGLDLIYVYRVHLTHQNLQQHL